MAKDYILTGKDINTKECLDVNKTLHPETCSKQVKMQHEGSISLFDWITTPNVVTDNDYEVCNSLISWLNRYYPAAEYSLDVMAPNVIGGAKLGNHLNVTNQKLNVDMISLGEDIVEYMPTATNTQLGILKINSDYFTYTDGIIEPLKATTSVFGVSKLGTNTQISTFENVKGDSDSFNFAVGINEDYQLGVVIPKSYFGWNGYAEGDGIDISNHTISVKAATTSSFGGFKLAGSNNIVSSGTTLTDVLKVLLDDNDRAYINTTDLYTTTSSLYINNHVIGLYAGTNARLGGIKEHGSELMPVASYAPLKISNDGVGYITAADINNVIQFGTINKDVLGAAKLISDPVSLSNWQKDIITTTNGNWYDVKGVYPSDDSFSGHLAVNIPQYIPAENNGIIIYDDGFSSFNGESSYSGSTAVTIENAISDYISQALSQHNEYTLSLFGSGTLDADTHSVDGTTTGSLRRLIKAILSSINAGYSNSKLTMHFKWSSDITIPFQYSDSLHKPIVYCDSDFPGSIYKDTTTGTHYVKFPYSFTAQRPHGESTDTETGNYSYELTFVPGGEYYAVYIKTYKTYEAFKVYSIPT